MSDDKTFWTKWSGQEIFLWNKGTSEGLMLWQHSYTREVWAFPKGKNPNDDEKPLKYKSVGTRLDYLEKRVAELSDKAGIK